MIKKLQHKFIILSTLSLILLLGIIVMSSSLLTYRELVADADMTLTMIVENNPHFAPMLSSEKERKLREEFLIEEKERFQEEPFIKKDERRTFVGKQRLSPEMMYEARFFMVELSLEGDIMSVSTERIAMVDDVKAKDYAKQVYKRTDEAGFIGDFRYRKLFEKKETKNDICVIFLDCGRKLFTFRNTLLINCLISFLGFVIISIIIIFLSGRIVRPVSESYEKQKQFISVAGHELRTPVTIIDADAEILAMEIGDENEWLSDIRNQTSRMADLTNNLLTLSRMDANQQQYTRIDFPISDIVDETVHSFQVLARSRGRNIKTEVIPMLSFCGDENSMRQLVGILLDNAIKYSNRENILLKLEKRNHLLYLSVKNNSEQVSSEQLRHFFDRFYRTEQSSNLESGGYGLGLSIAKSIVEAHKGKITASMPDTDTIQITVTLPIK
jgi:Signal transduction histidine kinase